MKNRKNKLLDNGRNRDGENNDHNPLLEGARCAEELDDALLA
jgi:hypothetical protein